VNGDPAARARAVDDGIATARQRGADRALLGRRAVLLRLAAAAEVAVTERRNELVAFWRRCEFTSKPFAHPEDLAILNHFGRYVDTEPKDFDAFIASLSFGDPGDHRLDLSLLPNPMPAISRPPTS
jgi:hypothetical protein